MESLNVKQISKDLQKRKQEIEEDIKRLIDKNKYYATKELYRKLNYVDELLTICEKINEKHNTIEEIQELFGECDELHEMKKSLPILENELKFSLLEGENYPDVAIIEVRPAAGGDEASIFAMELLKMYQIYCVNQGWKTSVSDLNISNKQTGDLKISDKHDSLKLAVLRVEGKSCYKHLFLESGVHRVQRIPETEANGRVHTSTVTVSVLKEEKEIEVVIEEKDLRIDVFRASGAGGQHVNTTESAVRITHLPTGLSVQCQDERSQHENKARALKNLKEQIYGHMHSENKKERDDIRQEQIGRGDRSEKIKTYNFPDNRVTDHRYGIAIYDLKSIIKGNLENLLKSSYAAYQAKLLSEKFS
jgi:peptide chain release factor 1